MKKLKIKNYYLLMVFLLGSSLYAGCTNSKRNGDDSVKKAEKMNEKKEDIKNESSDFMVKAASGGIMEVELGKIAKQNARNQRVKNFGEMMVRDHSKANQDLKTLSASKNITLPTTTGEDHQRQINDLSKIKGSDFDERYMEMMVDDHKEDINLFEKASQSKDTDVSTFALKTLPVLRTHLDSATAINNALKNSKNK